MGIRKYLSVKTLNNDRGSLSLLIFSLFILTLFTLLILTDISSIYLAKRSLTQITEAAAQRGASHLDTAKYYSSTYTIKNLASNILNGGEEDPGIPIDCQNATRDARETLNDWTSLGSAIIRDNLKDTSILEISCDGFQISLITTAVAKIPFVLPFTGISEVRITSRVGIFDERKNP